MKVTLGLELVVTGQETWIQCVGLRDLLGPHGEDPAGPVEEFIRGNTEVVEGAGNHCHLFHGEVQVSDA